MQAAERIELDALPGAPYRSWCVLTQDLGHVSACTPDHSTKILQHRRCTA